MELTYKRILLKISGEVLAGGKGMGIDYDTVLNICSAVKECCLLYTSDAADE